MCLHFFEEELLLNSQKYRNVFADGKVLSSRFYVSALYASSIAAQIFFFIKNLIRKINEKLASEMIQ